MTGSHKKKWIFLLRIIFTTSSNIKISFALKKKQFPIKLTFALTINKSQGQTIPNVGIYLLEHVFTHDQLYVALSRAQLDRNIKILIERGNVDGEQGIYTQNVVYKEILSDQKILDII